MERIVLASGNRGKIREIQAILGEGRYTVLPQSDFATPEAEETGLTFVENAILKARNAAHHSGLPAMADDSGLAVDWLDGAPGVYSARYAGIGASDQANLEKLLEAMQDVPDEQRGARFICAMVFLRHAADPCPLVALGQWEGRILREARGDNGFGYDPVFWVPEQGRASAELPPDVKNRLSHRGQAVRALCAQLERAFNGTEPR
ncbi:RdgB/HAM1 family non-canonical purine NTP pyrophosphatase [Methylogaea oryzae]|uniref:dITP/XTP pyrophosphatase n=1 Tax=Methylogaea oryzae TaxID=1295382 RepID=A0A8D5AFQ3_9GAMM|nr:RdgB/HAM1 family non-canonical purine NTP pyrophosphatase [Methylogaea oryzae]BBL69553.1 non-canonical purine NTP pyrophosphatase [Methylogaea oryzae]